MKRSVLSGLLVLLLLLVAAGIASASPVISSVYPSSAPNDGSVVLTIQGSGFDKAVQVRLNKCKLKTGGSSEAPFSGSIITKTSGMIVAEFNLAGKKVGDYDISVNAPDPAAYKPEDWGVGEGIFEIYQAGTKTPTPTSTTTTTTTTRTTTTSTGSNSVFFETDPPGATIFLDGEAIGTSTFTYNTYKDGVHDVIARMAGYVDYVDRVTIVDNSRTRFYARLTPVSGSPSTITTALTPGAYSSPVKTATTARKSTLKIPTPLGTFTYAPEEAPADPAMVLCAAGIGAIFFVIRRR